MRIFDLFVTAYRNSLLRNVHCVGDVDIIDNLLDSVYSLFGKSLVLED